MGHSHGSDIRDDELAFQSQFASEIELRATGIEYICFHSIFYNEDLAPSHVQALDQIVLKGRRHHHNSVRPSVEEIRSSREAAVQDRGRTSNANCSQRFRPQIPHLENERSALQAGYPPPRKSH